MTAVVAPCFNEEATIVKFLEQLENVLAHQPGDFSIVIVDDCSQDASMQLLSKFTFTAPNISFHLLRLQFNIGHQGAVYQGLLYVSTLNPERVIIMDSDGEDDPAAIPLLLAKNGFEIVEVKRGKRSENFSFKLSYKMYRLLFRFVTGKTIDYGNYCMITNNIVERIKHTSFIHFPAYLLKQKASRASIVFNRSKRIDGKSKMGYKGLLLHAFKSMIEFSEDLLLLFFRMFVIIIATLGIVFINVFYQKFVSQTAIPGWFSSFSVSLIILAILCMGFFIVGLLLLNLMHQQNIRSFREIYSVVKLADHESTPEKH